MASDAKSLIRAVLTAAVPSGSGRWVELPGFVYGVPKPTRDVDAAKNVLAEAFVRLYAIAALRHFGPKGGDVEFVLLCKLEDSGDRLEFHSYTPYPEIVSHIKTLIASPGSGAHVARALKGFEGKVASECVFPEAYLFPVVAICSPTKKHFRFTYRNQFNDPDQFLNPYHCKTTSGFLNFVGCLLHKQAGKPDARIQVDNMHAVLGKGLDPFIRWVYDLTANGGFYPENVLVNVDNPEAFDVKYTG
jgi:hypothetical protein